MVNVENKRERRGGRRGAVGVENKREEVPSPSKTRGCGRCRKREGEEGGGVQLVSKTKGRCHRLQKREGAVGVENRGLPLLVLVPSKMREGKKEERCGWCRKQMGCPSSCWRRKRGERSSRCHLRKQLVLVLKMWRGSLRAVTFENERGVAPPRVAAENMERGGLHTATFENKRGGGRCWALVVKSKLIMTCVGNQSIGVGSSS